LSPALAEEWFQRERRRRKVPCASLAGAIFFPAHPIYFMSLARTS